MVTSVNFTNNQLDIPRSVNAIERKALRELLNTFWMYRVILVTAPPGYGKTTLISQFVEQANIPTVWHSIEERDRDLPNFLSHNIRALRNIAPGIEDLSTTPANPRDAATYITSYIRDNISDHILYVLDDLQLITGAVQTEQYLRVLVELLPPKCHLVLISRTLPDLPLAELIAKGAVIAIGQDQLRFTSEEAYSLARTLGSSITEDQISQRVKHLEGWPVGLTMSLQPLPDEIEMSVLQGQHGPEALFYSLATVTLQKQPPVLRDFLLSSSVLSRLTPELCDKVLNLPDSENAFSLTLSRGLFITQLTNGLVYHRLFRSFLQHQLKHTDPDRFQRLHHKAGDWFRNQDDLDTAFEHYIAAGMIAAALSIVERAHMAYFNQGKVETLLTWRALLGEHAERIPQLIYKCAMIYTDRYLYEDAESELQIAAEAFEIVGDRIGLADVQLQSTMMMMRRGRHSEVIEIMSVLAADTSLPERIIGRAKHYLALSYLAAGEGDRAVQVFEEILPVYERNQDLYALSAVLQDMEVAYTRQGRMDDASRSLQRVVSLRRQLGRPNALALALNNLGYHYHQRRNYQEAIRTLEEGLQILEQNPSRRAESYLLWTLGDVRRDLGGFQEALQLYERAYELSDGMEPSLQQSVTLSISTLYRWQGNYALAARLAREVSESATPESSDQLMARARMAMAVAQQSQVYETLDTIFDSLKKMRAVPEHRLCALFCAHILLLAERSDLVEDYLHVALSTQSEVQRQCAQDIVAEIAHSPLLRNYIAPKVRYQTIHELVTKLESHSHQRHLKTILHTENPGSKHTFSLRVQTFGGEIISRDGTPVPTSAWRASRARDFFLYLLFEGAQTRDAISLMFWPDNSAKSVRSNFHTTLYRTRHALGDNVIVFGDELYGVNAEVEINCDALAMEDCIQQARLLSPRDARAEDLYHRAIQLYRGDFLPSLEGNWIDTRRHQFFEMHIESLLGAGQCARVNQNYREALSFYEKALKRDPYREEIYRAVFMCYAELSEPSQIKLHFRQMETLLRTELGISPSPETIALVQNLL